MLFQGRARPAFINQPIMPQPSSRLTVLVTSTARYPFVQDDIDVLGRYFELDVYFGSGPAGAWQVFNRARRADVAFGWFGSVYTFFMVLGARLGRGGSIVMLGGADVANEPDLNYGIWRSRWKGALLGWALRRADRVFAVDASLRAALEKSSGRTWTAIEALPTGYDVDHWKPGPAKEAVVLTVARCDTPDRARVKGIDLLVEAARRLPGIRFVAIGPSAAVREHFAGAMPPNIEMLEAVPRGDLLARYQTARVYCQPSRREGLPNALCEAMLCACIPVGTPVGGVPTAIGDAGFVVEPSADAIAAAIDEAMRSGDERGNAARRRICEKFPRSRREHILTATIRQLGGAEDIQ